MYAALWIPRLPLQAALNGSSALSGGQDAAAALVVVDENARKPLVLDLTREAQRKGVEVGLTVPQAMARCAGLGVVARSLQAEAQLGELLFHAAYSISPRVERSSNELALVDLRGVSEQRARARWAEIQVELGAQGLELRCGMASACSLAALAARHAGRDALRVLDLEGGKQGAALRLAFLDALPVEAGEPSEELSDVLESWGLSSLGAFARLERSAVGSRLGMEGLRLWDRLNGVEKRVIVALDLPPVYEADWEFGSEVDSIEPVLFVLRRFVEQLCARLRMGHAVAQRLELELELAYGEPLRLAQKAALPSADSAALFSVLAGRLEGLETQSPVSRLRLRIEAAPARQRQLGLFESAVGNPSRLEMTVAKLAGIVGAENVGWARLDPSGRPDAFTMEGPADEGGGEAVETMELRCGMPLRRFRPLLKARVELQGRGPIWLGSAAASGFVRASRGPFLHSGCWWEEQASWSRVEWDVELNRGGLYRLVKERGEWFVEGEYD